MKRILKTKNGITLIALVITIIVLLLLAGVTVATLTGENGLLSKAQLSKERNAEAEQDEKDKLSSYEQEIDNYGTWERTGGTLSINNIVNYSKDEKVVGTWIDNKPLYQKTVECGALPAGNESKTVSHNVENIDTICYVEGIALWDDGKGSTMLPTYNGIASDHMGRIDVNKTNVMIKCNGGWNHYNGIVTFRYTKTTDTAPQQQ